MVELLKTSMMVTVTVIPPHPDGAPRRGCNLPNCPYAFGARTSSADSDSPGGGSGREGDYENVGGDAAVEPQVCTGNLSVSKLSYSLSEKKF